MKATPFYEVRISVNPSQNKIIWTKRLGKTVVLKSTLAVRGRLKTMSKATVVSVCVSLLQTSVPGSVLGSAGLPSCICG